MILFRPFLAAMAGYESTQLCFAIESRVSNGLTWLVCSKNGIFD